VPSCAAHLGKRRAERSCKVPDGPPVRKKRSPTLADNKRRARKANSSRNKNKRKRAASQVSERKLAVHDGQTWLGTIREINGRFIAITARDNRQLGIFADATAAADAIDAEFGDRP
jgi:hypothetical protein